MHFGEYELSPCLIGLSPLPTVHPKTFQRLSVRSSNKFHLIFNLTIGSSHGFASKTTDHKRPIQTRFRFDYRLLTLNQASNFNS